MINIKSEKEIELMKIPAEILKKVLAEVEKSVRPGVTTLELDQIATRIIKENGAIPSFFGVPCPYKGGKSFKHALCLSVNDEIIHGIPSKYVLKEGDLLCLDMGVYKCGYHADAGRTFGVGKISPVAQKLIDVSKRAFFEGVKYAKEGYRVGDISNAIETYVTKEGFTLLEEYQGHGVGKELHEDPGIPNIGKKGTGPRLQKGMAIAVEPMICEGSNKVYVKNDKWTVATVDKKLTAYYENTLVITDNDPEILTY